MKFNNPFDCMQAMGCFENLANSSVSFALLRAPNALGQRVRPVSRCGIDRVVFKSGVDFTTWDAMENRKVPPVTLTIPGQEPRQLSGSLFASPVDTEPFPALHSSLHSSNASASSSRQNSIESRQKHSRLCWDETMQEYLGISDGICRATWDLLSHFSTKFCFQSTIVLGSSSSNGLMIWTT